MSIFFKGRVPAHNQGDNTQGNNRESGFTLLELLIVAAILGIIIAIAIPNLLGARKNANVVSAKKSIDSIRIAEVMYYNSNGKYSNDPTTLAINDYISDSSLRDAMVAEGATTCDKPKSGYCFKPSGITNPYEFGWLGAPLDANNIADTALAVYTDGVIRCKKVDGKNKFEADATSPSCESVEDEEEAPPAPPPSP